ncbi:Interleukin-8 [Liparis tanakae]|uniref:Interleukin-8 n=1 Tax=Liparis tanakae TaxID=230148 RepID=A0A4Z2ILU0_9TELE|nr:Interleukin-8 [Liparis tanakae]
MCHRRGVSDGSWQFTAGARETNKSAVSIFRFPKYLRKKKRKMMSSRVLGASIVVLLALLAVSEGMSLRSLGVELHCRCIQTESRDIRAHISTVELIPVNSHCEDSEIIATLKKTGQKVCLNPKAIWVKRMIKRFMSK